MKKLRFDAIRQEVEREYQKLLALVQSSGYQVPEPTVDWNSARSVAAFAHWYLDLWTGANPGDLPATEERAAPDGRDCLEHTLVCLLLPVMMRSSRPGTTLTTTGTREQGDAETFRSTADVGMREEGRV